MESTQYTNKGTGAGGANTNKYGKEFEEKTYNEAWLLRQGFVKHKMYMQKRCTNYTVTFIMQTQLKSYIKNKYGITLFRCPDEAYLFEFDDGRKMLKIIEKKEQKVEGSVETKLWSGPSLKREYEIILDGFTVEYAFCLSSFLKSKMVSDNQKYKVLHQILQESNIDVFYGDDADYLEQLLTWVWKYIE